MIRNIKMTRKKVENKKINANQSNCVENTFFEIFLKFLKKCKKKKIVENEWWQITWTNLLASLVKIERQSYNLL